MIESQNVEEMQKIKKKMNSIILIMNKKEDFFEKFNK